MREILNYIEKNFKDLGPNKKQEIIRLLFEISKRDGKDFKDILNPFLKKSTRYSDLKRVLIKRRFPGLHSDKILKLISLPDLNIEPENEVKIKSSFEIIPKNIFIEEKVINSSLAQNIKKKFPESNYSTISSYKEQIKTKFFNLSSYNERKNNFYVINENYDFFLHCPCSPKSECCKYHIMKLGTGCAFECMYCYMQAYINSPGIILPANIEDYFDKFDSYPQNIRVGTGQFTDSLVFDDITEYSPKLVEFFKKKPNTIFEFKTKSDNTALLLTVKPGNNILVSWSLNPQKVIDEIEIYTASLKDRLKAAVRCMNAGYRLGFHFDPIIYYNGWEDDYKNVVDELFKLIDPRCIRWISLGCLRMTPKLKQAVENRFPNNKILDEEFILGYDDKLRYDFDVRLNIYKKFSKWINEKDKNKDIPIYLCMEDKEMCSKTRIFPDDDEMKKNRYN